MDREKEFYRRIREGYSDRYAFVEIMDTIVEELEIEDGETNDTSTIEEVVRSMVDVEREDEETHDTTSTGVAVAMEVEDEETNDTSTIEEVVPTTGVTVKGVEMEDEETHDTSTMVVSVGEASNHLCPPEEAIPSSEMAVAVEVEDEETHDTTSTGVAVAMEVEDEETNDTSTIEEVVPTTGVTVKGVEMEDEETHDTSTMVVSVDEASNHLCPPEEAIPSSVMAVAVEVEDEETNDTSTIEEVVPTTGVTVKVVEMEDECADEEKGALGDGPADSSHQAETIPQKVGKKRAFKSFFARAWKALRRSLCCCCSVADEYGVMLAELKGSGEYFAIEALNKASNKPTALGKNLMSATSEDRLSSLPVAIFQ